VFRVECAALEIPLTMTRTSLFSPIPLLVAGAVFLMTGSPLTAQAEGEFQITKIDPALVTTPAVNYSGATGKNVPGSPKRWIELEVSFTWLPRTTAEKYADDVVVNYYVLLSNRNAQAPQGTMLTGQVTLMSIPAKQPDLKAVMYVSPRALERFFDGKIPASISSAITDIGVTISKGGQVVAQKSLNSKSGAWWPQIQQTSGYLLSKPETPFAPLNWDYYETVKKTQNP